MLTSSEGSGGRAPGRPSDIHLLELLGYHLLEGEPPKSFSLEQLREAFDGAGDELRRLFEVGHVFEDPGEDPWEDQDFFRAVLSTMLEVNPRHRFKSLGDALRAVQDPKAYAAREIRASLAWCAEKPDFFRNFYETFFESCPGAERLFGFDAGSADDGTWRRQESKLLAAAGNLLDHFEHGTGLGFLAARHKQTLDERLGTAPDVALDPDWFDRFVLSLAATACRFDNRMSAAADGSRRFLRYNRWRQVMKPGAEVMRRRQLGQGGRRCAMKPRGTPAQSTPSQTVATGACGRGRDGEASTQAGGGRDDETVGRIRRALRPPER